MAEVPSELDLFKNISGEGQFSTRGALMTEEAEEMKAGDTSEIFQISTVATPDAEVKILAEEPDEPQTSSFMINPMSDDTHSGGVTPFLQSDSMLLDAPPAKPFSS